MPGASRVLSDSLYGLYGISSILQLEPVSAQEEEYGNTIMTEEGDQMDRQQQVGVGQHAVEAVDVALYVLIFILLYDAAEPVAIVMEHDGQDGQSAQGSTLHAGEVSESRAVIVDG